jgi:uncharacterized Zn-finger protein
LRRHMDTHTHDKPFKFDQCYAEFSSASYLKRHKKIHTRKQFYKCISRNSIQTMETNVKLSFQKQLHGKIM